MGASRHGLRGSRIRIEKRSCLASSMPENQSSIKPITERNSIGSDALARRAAEAADDRCGPGALGILGAYARVKRTACQVRDDSR